MSTTLIDYAHAHNLYVTGNMRLSPKFKHLFSAVLNIDSSVSSVINGLANININEINLLCRSSDLPRFDLQTETLNQYNRKKVIHTSVQYQPITLQFHDDNAGLTTLLLETYFRYYYADSNYTSVVGDVPRAYARSRGGINSAYSTQDAVSYRYGLDMPAKAQNFFRSIQLLQFHPQNRKTIYTSYTLVNPKISNYQHDNVTQEGSEFSINSLSISYEAVFYNRGELSISENSASGNYYDATVSPNTPVVSTGPGGASAAFPNFDNSASRWLNRYNS
jgi:hypothetical protein